MLDGSDLVLLSQYWRGSNNEEGHVIKIKAPFDLHHYNCGMWLEEIKIEKPGADDDLTVYEYWGDVTSISIQVVVDASAHKSVTGVSTTYYMFGLVADTTIDDDSSYQRT